MTRFKRRTRAATAGMLMTILLMLSVGPALGDTAVTRASAQTAEVQAVEGQGWLEKAACVGCMTLLFAAGASNIVGAIVVASAFPEAVAACGFGCAVAFME